MTPEIQLVLDHVVDSFVEHVRAVCIFEWEVGRRFRAAGRVLVLFFYIEELSSGILELQSSNLPLLWLEKENAVSLGSLQEILFHLVVCICCRV